jgi:hypothetical protein
MPLPEPETESLYDPEAIFEPNGPLDPTVMDEAVSTIMRGIQPDLTDTQAATSRRMYAAMRALAALHPRNAPELMLGVQALSAYHAANAAWHRGTLRHHQDDIRRHVTTAATAARAFDSMLRALERRQAKPLSVPVGRPSSRPWLPPDLKAIQHPQDDEPAHKDPMTDDELVGSWAVKAQQWLQNPNQGLDIANTPGILPDGGMIVPWNPTPAQQAYMERRLIILYVREQAEIRRSGSSAPITIRPTRPGDLIP